MGLVVVRDSKVMGLHCSGPELHAGQSAIIQHGPRLAECQLFFSRRPCATCLKMIINGEDEEEPLKTASVLKPSVFMFLTVLCSWSQSDLLLAWRP